MKLLVLLVFVSCAHPLTELERDEMRAWHAKLLMDLEASDGGR